MRIPDKKPVLIIFSIFFIKYLHGLVESSTFAVLKIYSHGIYQI
jgi:hypothetical protein